MKELAVYEAKTRLSELLVEVERGEQFVITRRGVAVARLVSAAAPAARRAQSNTQRQRVSQALGALAELRQGLSLDLPLRQAIESGRD
ncbi:MAG: type II toxin-antitoxin system prevent-host-death family antitoxin [Ideonella sp.]|jgi:prevent-host-death family protein|nr:type II toxin-antitoxin system prevent-host-death family antitoxin [Ideonella sp.]MBL0151350.1 type II toxin-antitoxin system prevent-host-death family antitoxin [Ideonella sp.]